MNTFKDVTLGIYRFIAGQPIPMDLCRVKTNFFTACRPPLDFNESVDFLIEVGALVEASIVVNGEQSTLIIATPKTMQEFAEQHKEVV